MQNQAPETSAALPAPGGYGNVALGGDQLCGTDDRRRGDS